MTWHFITTSVEHLDSLLATIRGAGGTVTSYTPAANGIQITWTTRI